VTMAVTIRDVAQQASVSIATVSRVLNNHTSVKDGVRQRVLQAATNLGYSLPEQFITEPVDSVNNSKRGLKEIGVLLYDPNLGNNAPTANPFWSPILFGASSEASKSKIKVSYQPISLLNQSPETLLANLREMDFSGILLVGPTDLQLVKLIQHLKLPLVLIDNYIPGLENVDSVMSNSFEGTREAVSHLIANGHRNIVFMGSTSTSGAEPVSTIYSIEQRAIGYRMALLYAGLDVNPQLFEPSKLTPEGGYEACKRLLARKVRFSSIFCANDMVAIGALKALREAGLRVPEDVSLVGFDDLDVAAHLSPALTTVRIQKGDLGAVGVKTLLNRAQDPTSPAMTITLGVELIQRESVGNPRQ
jgi:DNA-binding LacI/PurR family transcriptional regulator